MTFTTVTFVIFLVLVFGLYWLIGNKTGQNGLLLLSSYVFYGWWDWRYCLLMLGSSLLDFFVGQGLDRAQRPALRRGLLMISLVGQLGLLGFYKYFDFFAKELQALASALGWHADPFTLNVILPVGISFYTFQTLSYVILIYQRKMHATTHLIDYMAYVSFFPQLVAGPIEKANQLLPQFLNDRRFDYSQAVDGCRQMLWGFFKKMVLADNLAPLVDQYYNNISTSDGLQLSFATFCFAFQIYCDFSAYSDIAVGTGKLFGIHLMRNFAYPYFSQSVAEFWRRWHISLSTWFRDYVYIPLGGNRGSQLRTVVNVMITFMVSGLWHGANWNFVIWGALNGLGTLPAVLFGSGQRRGSSDTPGGESLIPDPLTLMRILGTFIFACVAWVFFRTGTLPDASFGQAVTVLKSFVYPGPWTWPWYTFYHETFWDPYTYRLTMTAWTMIWLAVFVAWEWAMRRHLHGLALGHWPRPLRWLLYTAVIWIILYFGTQNQGSFIYFQF